MATEKVNKNPEPEKQQVSNPDEKVYTPEDLQKAYRDGFNDGFSKVNAVLSEDGEPEE